MVVNLSKKKKGAAGTTASRSLSCISFEAVLGTSVARTIINENESVYYLFRNSGGMHDSSLIQ